MECAVPVDYKVKLKESEKKDKYHDLARELKKLWNMKVTFIQITIGALCTVTKGLIKVQEDSEIRGRVETTKTSTLLRSARILRRVLETWEDSMLLIIQWNTISFRWCEKLSICNNNNDYDNNQNSEKTDTYLDLTIKLRNLWNIKLTVRPIKQILIGAIGTAI